MSDAEAIKKVREILRKYSVHDDYHVYATNGDLISALREINEAVNPCPKAMALTPQQIRQLAEGDER